MKPLRRLCVLTLAVLSLPWARVAAADPAPVAGLIVTNGTKHLLLPLVPGVDEFKVLAETNVANPFTETAGTISGYDWLQSGLKPFEFFRLELTPKSSNSVAAATLLNRLAYGPTPDELERVSQIGPQAYIAEQLAPENIQENLAIDEVKSSSDWQRVVITGTATSSTLYLYMTAPGDCYLDDIKIVAGSNADNGVNLVKNGDFEAGFANWTLAPIVTNSVVVSDTVHSGSGALHLYSSRAGSSSGTAIVQASLGLSTKLQYTLSFWYKRGQSSSGSLVVRLSGSDPGTGIYAAPDSLGTRLALGTASWADLCTWHILHAVQSKKQLLEVLLQFLENHFVTQESKSRDYMDNQGLDESDQIATNFEYRERQKWAEALQNPQCTFYDLLKISAESPAMIIYLDTVNSKGSGGNIANENYARELLELFTFGVDNGYDQNDITVMSRAWTGWSVRIVDPANEFNPFAPQSRTLRPGGTNRTDGSITIPNLAGVWAFNYKPENHGPGQKLIFPGKVVPDRFGPPYAGRNYELNLTPGNGKTNWQYITMTGTATSSTLYMYMTDAGDCYIDDLKLVPGEIPEEAFNTVANGNFDLNLAGWTVSSMVSQSSISTDSPHSGAGALHLVSSGQGTSSGTAIRRADLKLANGQPYTLSYWYRPGAASQGELVVRLSNSTASRGIYSSPGAGTNSIQDGYAVLAHLANQPFTQEFISVKLCRLFVHDDFATGYDFTDPNLSPEGRLVRECMRAWEENEPKGQIRKVLEVIFNSDLFRTQAASMQKVKTPLEFTVSAVRALRAYAAKDANGNDLFTANTDGTSLNNAIIRMGRMRLFDRDTPDGYPEAAAPWISAGTLAERLRFCQALLLPNSASGRGDAGSSFSDPVALLKLKLPQASWNDASAVANYFLGILFPAEGKANLDSYRTQALNYLNTADDGVTSSPFSSLGNTTSNYDYRVRGMVAMLMTFPRFQEQ